MISKEKISRIQSVIGHPDTAGIYYKLLKEMGVLKVDYPDYMTTEPINCDME